MNVPDFPNASLIRRLGAILYDTLLIFAWLWTVTALYMFGLSKSFSSTESFQQFLEAGGILTRHEYPPLLLLALYLFFAFFWRKSGQTLGMQAWRLKLVSTEGGRPSHVQCFLRFCTAIVSFLVVGLGYLWILRQPHTAWHDRYSDTRVVLLPKHWHKQFQPY
jgi:uncharacterized RDD family membrane protein YckC